MAVDILILAVVAVAAVTGFMRGLLSQVGQIAGLVVGVLASRVAAPMLVDFFTESGDSSIVATVVSYGIVFLLAYGVTWMVARALKLVVRVAQLGVFDRIGGAVFKVFLWGMMLSVVLNFVILVGGDEATVQSDKNLLRSTASDLAPKVLGYFSQFSNN